MAEDTPEISEKLTTREIALVIEKLGGDPHRQPRLIKAAKLVNADAEALSEFDRLTRAAKQQHRQEQVRLELAEKDREALDALYKLQGKFAEEQSSSSAAPEVKPVSEESRNKAEELVKDILGPDLFNRIYGKEQ